MKVTKSQLKELIRHTIVDLTEKTFGSKAQYDAYRKKHNLKPGSKHKVDGKTVTVRDVKKISKSAKKKADKFAAAQNAKLDAAEKAAKKKVKESTRRKYTIKEVRMWMKKLEENRYKKVYNSDARRVAWMVNNEGIELSEMPMSFKKKWTKAQYGRERYLAKEFLKSKSEQMNESKLRGMIREIIKEQLNEGKYDSKTKNPNAPGFKKSGPLTNKQSREVGSLKNYAKKTISASKDDESELDEAPKPIHHSDMRMLYVPKKDFKNAVKLLRLNIKHGNVEVEKKPSDKVKGFYRFTTTKKMFDDVVTHLAMKKIGVKTIAKGKM